MKNRTLFTLIIILFSSCETVVQVDLIDRSNNLVVESYLEFSDETNSGMARVLLSLSSPFYDEINPTYVSNATVTINDTYTLIEHPDSLGYYVSESPIPYLGEEEFSLDIIADIEGKEGHWNAKDNFTTVPPIDSIYSIYLKASPPFSEEGYYCKIIVKDKAFEQNFYHLNVNVNDSLSFSLNGGTKRSSILRDDLFDGKEIDIEVNNDPLKVGNTLNVVLSSISEEVYLYYFNLYTLLTETSGIGAAPPFPLTSNLVSLNDNFDNALGSFQVRSTTTREIIIEE